MKPPFVKPLKLKFFVYIAAGIPWALLKGLFIHRGSNRNRQNYAAFLLSLRLSFKASEKTRGTQSISRLYLINRATSFDNYRQLSVNCSEDQSTGTYRPTPSHLRDLPNAQIDYNGGRTSTL